MTVTAEPRAARELHAPYYVEGIALLTQPGSAKEKFDALLAGGSGTQGLDPAERRRRAVGARGAAAGRGAADRQPGQRHPGARFQPRRRRRGRPLDGVVDGQARSPTSTPTPARSGSACCTRRRSGRAISTGCSFVNTTWNVAMFGHRTPSSTRRSRTTSACSRRRASRASRRSDAGRRWLAAAGCGAAPVTRPESAIAPMTYHINYNFVWQLLRQVLLGPRCSASSWRLICIADRVRHRPGAGAASMSTGRAGAAARGRLCRVHPQPAAAPAGLSRLLRHPERRRTSATARRCPSSSRCRSIRQPTWSRSSAPGSTRCPRD